MVSGLTFMSLIHLRFVCFLSYIHKYIYIYTKFLDQGLNPYHLQWKHGILTTGPPGKSLLFIL